jgi:hypothetical protein
VVGDMSRDGVVSRVAVAAHTSPDNFQRVRCPPTEPRFESRRKPVVVGKHAHEALHVAVLVLQLVVPLSSDAPSEEYVGVCPGQDGHQVVLVRLVVEDLLIFRALPAHSTVPDCDRHRLTQNIGGIAELFSD